MTFRHGRHGIHVQGRGKLVLTGPPRAHLYGKSMTEVNPQDGERLPLNFMKNTSSKHVVYKNCFCFDIQNNICTQHVLNLYFSGNSMNNLSSYCGLTDSRMRASEKDLPVSIIQIQIKLINSVSK